MHIKQFVFRVIKIEVLQIQGDPFLYVAYTKISHIKQNYISFMEKETISEIFLITNENISKYPQIYKFFFIQVWN